jgi:hypothetical protein
VVGALYVKPPFNVVDRLPTVTTTFDAPAEPAGVEHVIDVGDTTTTFVHAAPPTVTVAPLAKPAPVIVIAVPPAVEPDVGLMDVITGAG